MPLTVVIPTHGRPDLLERTLGSLAACARPEGFAGVVVIENGGRHGAEEVVAGAAEWLQVRYRHHEAGNKSAALNRVLEEVTKGWLLFLDDDVRVVPEFLVEYARAMQADGGAHFLAGPMAVDHEAPPPEWLRTFLPLSVLGWSPAESEVTDPIALGCNWAVPRRCFEVVGGFDENLGPGAPSGATGQEQEMQRRLLAAGIAGRMVPEALVWHYVPAERCTPAWALHRAYRNGIHQGMLMIPSRVQLFGYPRWMMRKYLEGAIRLRFSLWRARDPESAFRLRHAWALFRGRMAGARYRRNEVRT